MLIFSSLSLLGGIFPYLRAFLPHPDLHNHRGKEELTLLALARQWLAAELHDDAGQQLRVLRMQLHILALEHPAVDLQPLREGLHRLQSSLQQLAGEEEQAVFDRERFEQQVQRLLQDLRLAGLTVRQEGSWPVEWQAGVEELWQVYRILQELVQNVLAHAGADLLELTIAQEDRYLRVEVRDRCRGTAAAAAGGVGSGRGMGSRNLRRRAKLIGAEIQRRRHRDGTEVTILISINPTIL
jgi:signal transduction histidine kinase